MSCIILTSDWKGGDSAKKWGDKYKCILEVEEQKLIRQQLLKKEEYKERETAINKSFVILFNRQELRIKNTSR